MITFSKIGHFGRLGNQLFQYAILKSVSLKTGFEIRLPRDFFKREWHGQMNLLSEFILPSAGFQDIETEHLYIEPYPRAFDENIFNIKDNTDFEGFFQNARYYNDIKSQLRREFILNNKAKDNVVSSLAQFNNNTVSLHLRRGDLSDNTNPIDSGWSNDFSEGSVLHSYYSKALEIIPKDSTILLFTGGSRNNSNENDIKWCKKHFNDSRIVFVRGLTDLESFYVMSNCDYNITSFASTFSWWASFLNERENIIAPKLFYPTEPHLKTEDVYPPYWQLL